MSVDKPDPRKHQPDPVYAHQRDELPHPSLADPVLRHHINLPPLTDPYEERRRRAEAWARERSKHVLRQDSTTENTETTEKTRKTT